MYACSYTRAFEMISHDVLLEKRETEVGYSEGLFWGFHQRWKPYTYMHPNYLRPSLACLGDDYGAGFLATNRSSWNSSRKPPKHEYKDRRD